MDTDLERLMSGLRRDHRNMALLLDLLDAESELLASAGEPDYDLVAEIMQYMTEYPDVVHHPREDLIYRHLRSVHPDLDDELQRVETDHQHIEASGRKLKNDLEAISAGADSNRDAVVAELREYSRQLRDHMHWEEQELFARADKLENDEHWSALLAKGGGIDDPLFGTKASRKYRRLLAHIQQRVAWDSQKYMV